MIKRLFIPMAASFLMLFLSSQNAAAQRYETAFIGIQSGLSFQFGSRVNRMGIFVKGFVTYKDFQWNADVRGHFNMSSFGPPLSGWELMYKIGMVWGWGAQDTIGNDFWTPVSNQTGLRNSIGYSFCQYFDQIGTDQTTGIGSIQLYRWQFIIENDAFAPPPADKFRTAAAALTYRFSATSQVAINSILWTGDPFTHFIDTQTFDSGYPSRYGYRDMTRAEYGNYSHGIFTVQLHQQLPHYQEVRYDLGFDSEYVRHILQNVIIHDFYLLPPALNPAKHPHIPMVSSDGSQYLFLPYQKVKPATFFGQIALNPGVFY